VERFPLKTLTLFYQGVKYMSEETKLEELDLIEDVTEVQEELQDEDLVEDVEGDTEENIAEEEVVVEEVEELEEAAAPKTKAGIINAMYSEMSKMKKSDLQAAYEKFMGKDDDGDDDDDDDDDDMDESVQDDGAEAIAATDKAIEKSKPGKVAEPKGKSKGKMKESYDFKADLDALVVADDNLSEGFQEKAATIFEAAVKTKVADEIDRLEAEYTQSLEEETASIQEQLVEKVDGYLNYVVENWMEENRLAVESGLRNEISESFMEALKGVFVEHYIDVPESKIDMVDDLAEQVQELEEHLTKATEDNIRLSESVAQMRRSEILAEASQDLAVTEAEKLKKLAEDVDFEDEATFTRKVATLKESYFAKNITENIEEVEIATNADGEEIEVSPLMEKYLTALSKSVK
jgi:hypothetical protein